MGMTIDEHIAQLIRVKHYAAPRHYETLDMAIDTMRKYQQLQADYENRIKADMAAMLKDLRLRADETQGHEYNSDFWDGFFTYDDIIRAEINALKGE